MEGAEGADIEKKQVLEVQCREASKSLFQKRRELQKLQKDYDEDARRLMEFKTKSQQLGKQNEEIQGQRGRIEKDLGDQMTKLQRAQNSCQSKYNNVRSVRGGVTFDESKENMEILAEVE